MSKLISVIIPTYNRAAFILDAVESVLNQRLPDGYALEVIIIDDGSTDNTESILQKLSDKIIYKKIPNSGRPAVPRNTGLELAHGELIAFQDSDDRWAKDKLLNQIPAFDDPLIGLSHGGVQEMSASGKVQKQGPLSQQKIGSDFPALVQSNFISTLTVMVRKNVIQEAGLFDESFTLRGVEDYELWLRIAAKHKLHHNPKTLAYYRRHDENISHSVDAHGESHLYRLFNHTRSKNVYSASQRILLNQKLIGLLPLQNFSRLHKKTTELYLRAINKLLRLRV